MHILLQSFDAVTPVATTRFNQIYRARDPELGREVILKFTQAVGTDRTSIFNLKREYALLQQIAPEMSAKAYGYKEVLDAACLMLELVEGQSLTEMLTEGRIFTAQEVLTIALSLAQALGELHSKSIMHKDVNPSNIVIKPNLTGLKLIDFGIASKLEREHKSLGRITQLEGTLQYLAPEQTGRMNRSIDYRADFYSLGATLYELLTGRPPYPYNDGMALVAAHISEPLTLPSQRATGVPKMLDDIISKLMAKAAESRYQSAYGLIKDLEQAQALLRQADALTVSLPLGRQDRTSQFSVPEKLYGREAQIHELLREFNLMQETHQGRGVVVAGVSGIGKSSLVNEVHKPLVKARGLFLSGKFNQFRRDVPYDAFITAFSELIDELLALPEVDLKKWRDTIQKAVGDNAAALLGLIPRLELLLGPQEPVSDLGSVGNANRLRTVFNDFIDAVAQEDHPIVLFIDDLQWADGGSLECLRDIFGKRSGRHILVILAYRDNEVDVMHPLSQLFEELDKDQASLHRISLRPLDKSNIVEILQDTLFVERDKTARLAQILFDKTGGNPFFIRELLTSLQEKGHLKFGIERGVWHWDDQAIENLSISSNVVEFVLQSLQTLPQETRDFIAQGSCIGHKFSLSQLVDLSGKTVDEVGRNLWVACQKQILIPEGENVRLFEAEASMNVSPEQSQNLYYRFAHDRIQQAAHLLFPEEKRARTKLAWARTMVRAEGGHLENSDKIVLIAEAYNQGSAYIESKEELESLATMNYRAALRARMSLAYSSAVSFCRSALQLLDSMKKNDPELIFSLRFLLAECLYFAQRTEEAEPIFQELLVTTQDRDKKRLIYLKRIELFAKIGRFAEACSEGTRALALYDVSFPERKAGQLGVMRELLRAKFVLKKHKIAELWKLPEVQDEAWAGPLSILVTLYDSTYQTDMNLYAFNVLKTARLIMSYGNHEGASLAYSTFGLVHAGILQDFDTGEALSQVGVRYGREKDSKTFLGRALFIRGCFVAHWTHNFRENMDILGEAEKILSDAGEINWLDYCRGIANLTKIFAANDLTEMEEYAQHYKALEELKFSPWAKPTLYLIRQYIGCLRNLEVDFRKFPESEQHVTQMIQEIEKTNITAAAAYVTTRAFVDTLFGRYAQALSEIEGQKPDGAIAMVFIPYYLFLKGFAATILRAQGKNPKTSTNDITKIMKQLEKLAQRVPMNYRHLYLLLSAEIERANGRLFAALQAYEQAMLAADSHGFFWAVGLAAERAASCAALLQQKTAAQAYLQRAIFAYQGYGAPAKVQHIETEFQELLRTSSFRILRPSTSIRGTVQGGGVVTGTITESGHTDSIVDTRFDLLAVVRSSQIIAGEVRLKDILHQVIQLVRQSTGASHAGLILPQQRGSMSIQDWVLQAYQSGQDTPKILLNESIAGSEHVCEAAIEYVLRTKTVLVLKDASQSKTYGDHPYIKRTGTLSLLALPLSNRSQVKAVVYIENREVSNAFPPERLEMLGILGTQVAISLENASLYEDLEHKVQERTVQLSERTRQISIMLENLAQGLFTLSLDGQNSSLQTTDCSRYLFEILEQKDHQQFALDDLLARSSLGKDHMAMLKTVLLNTLGESMSAWQMNAHQLPRSFNLRFTDGREKILELDWSPIWNEDAHLQRILVTIRDVTSLRQLQAEALAQTQHLSRVGNILRAGYAAFRNFLSQADKLLEDNRKALQDRQNFDLKSFFRNMHSLKGLCRMLNLTVLVDGVHQAEDRLSMLQRGEASLDELWSMIQADVAAITEDLEAYRTVLEKDLHGSAVAESESSRIDQIYADVRGLLLEQRSAPMQSVELGQRILHKIKAIHPQSLAYLVSTFQKEIDSLASALDKVTPRLTVNDDWDLLSDLEISTLREVLLHCLRNSVDHGIESAAIRRMHQKDEQGRIHIEAQETHEGRFMTIEDDGAGMNLEAIAQLAERKGFRGQSDDQLARLIFNSGFSTSEKVTDISGRGIGMNAVQAKLAGLGTSMTIEFTGTRNNLGFRPFRWKILFRKSLAKAS